MRGSRVRKHVKREDPTSLEGATVAGIDFLIVAGGAHIDRGRIAETSHNLDDSPMAGPAVKWRHARQAGPVTTRSKSDGRRNSWSGGVIVSPRLPAHR